MATTDKDYTITGATPVTSYSFDFPYMKAEDVQVELNGIRLIPIEEEDLTSTPPKPHKFTRQTTQIELVDTPTSGDKLRIYRATDDSGLTSTFYPGSAIRSNDLNDNFTQNLYSTQENTNDAAKALENSRVLVGGDYVTAITKAEAAVVTANTANTTAGNAVTTANTANTTAGNAVTTANTANTTAGNAVTTANTANTTAGNAVTTANAATTTANGAVTTANGAVTTANTASTNASAAVTTANTASTNASAAVTTANTASTNASSAVTTANTASTNASAAVTTANQAAADVAAAVLYTTVADKTALEALTPTEDAYYQVANSTGLANGTWTVGSDTYTLSSIPATYASTNLPLSGLTTKLTYTHSTKTYAYTAYTVNDADNRYLVGPTGNGNANEVLTTNGSGVLTWEVGGNVTIDAGNFDTGASLVSTTVTYDGGEFT